MNAADAIRAFGNAWRALRMKEAESVTKNGGHLYCAKCGGLVLTLIEGGFDTAASVFLSLRDRTVLVSCPSCHRYSSYELPQ